MAEGLRPRHGRDGHVRCAERRVHARRRQGLGRHRSARHDQGADLSADPRDGERLQGRRTAPTSAASSRASPTAMSAAPAPAASRMRARWSRRCSVCKKQNRQNKTAVFVPIQRFFLLFRASRRRPDRHHCRARPGPARYSCRRGRSPSRCACAAARAAFAIACKTAAEHDALRLKDIDKARKTAREIVAVGFEQLARERVAGVYRVADVLRVEVRAVFAQAALRPASSARCANFTRAAAEL